MNVNLNFEELKAAALEKAGIVAQKAKDLASIAKAKVTIRLEEEKIRKAQTELGKLYYRDFALGEEMDDAEYLPWCDKITESEAVIQELKNVIAELKSEGVEEEAAEEEPAKEEPAAEAPADAETPEASPEDFADTQKPE